MKFIAAEREKNMTSTGQFLTSFFMVVELSKFTARCDFLKINIIEFITEMKNREKGAHITCCGAVNGSSSVTDLCSKLQ